MNAAETFASDQKGKLHRHQHSEVTINLHPPCRKWLRYYNGCIGALTCDLVKSIMAAHTLYVFIYVFFPWQLILTFIWRRCFGSYSSEFKTRCPSWCHAQALGLELPHTGSLLWRLGVLTHSVTVSTCVYMPCIQWTWGCSITVLRSISKERQYEARLLVFTDSLNLIWWIPIFYSSDQIHPFLTTLWQPMSTKDDPPRGGLC